MGFVQIAALNDTIFPVPLLDSDNDPEPLDPKLVATLAPLGICDESLRGSVAGLLTDNLDLHLGLQREPGQDVFEHPAVDQLGRRSEPELVVIGKRRPGGKKSENCCNQGGSKQVKHARC